MFNMTIIEVLIAIATIAGGITASSVYFFRTNAQRLNDDSNRRDELNRRFMEKQHQETKESIMTLSNHFDNQLNNMQSRMDLSNSDMKEYVSSELLSVKQSIKDVQLNHDKTRDKMNEIEKEQLRLQLHLSQEYVKRNDYLNNN